MPVKRHTTGTLPHVTAEGQEESLPEFLAVMAEHGPQEENGPTWVLPDFTTQEYEPWLPGLEEEVDAQAAEKAPQIADEATRAIRDQPYEYTLDADAEDLDYAEYELSWNRRPTEEPIKVPSVRADRPSPTPRGRLQK